MLNGVIFNFEPIQGVLIADNFKDRLLGYMFKRQPHYNAILFKPCNSIHTFFMKFDIDVLFLDQNMEIIKKIDGLKPRKIIFPIKDAKIVIEGKIGLFRDYSVGDKLEVFE